MLTRQLTFNKYFDGEEFMVFIRFTCNSQALATQLKLGNDRISFELQSLRPDLHSKSYFSKNVQILFYEPIGYHQGINNLTSLQL